MIVPHTLLSPCRYLSQETKTVYFFVALKRYKDLFNAGGRNDMDWLMDHITDTFDMETVLALRPAALKYHNHEERSQLLK